MRQSRRRTRIKRGEEGTIACFVYSDSSWGGKKKRIFKLAREDRKHEKSNKKEKGWKRRKKEVERFSGDERGKNNLSEERMGILGEKGGTSAVIILMQGVTTRILFGGKASESG